MILRISLVLFNFRLWLSSNEEIYEQILRKYDWVSIRRGIFLKFQNLKFLRNEALIMDFIKASAKTRDGKKVRRKSWEKGHFMWWHADYKCMLADNPYGKQDMHLDTKGYIYVCEGDDVEANDWEETC